ncbi:MAG: hypothetical protein ACK5N8_05100 [Alphaproteobacteria bacterium]
MKKIITLTAFALLAFSVGNANAQSVPSCENLGYKKTSGTCASEGKEYLRCPTDTSKEYCIGEGTPIKTCADGGYLESMPSGKACTSIKYGDLNCYKNDCTVPCSGYSQSSCTITVNNVQKQGKLSGSTCTKNGVTYYSTCDTCSPISGPFFSSAPHANTFCTSIGRKVYYCSSPTGINAICDTEGHSGTITVTSPYFCDF